MGPWTNTLISASGVKPIRMYGPTPMVQLGSGGIGTLSTEWAHQGLRPGPPAVEMLTEADLTMSRIEASYTGIR